MFLKGSQKFINTLICDQGGTSFVDHSCYSCGVFVMLFARLLLPCGHLLGMDLLALVCDVQL